MNSAKRSRTVPFFAPVMVMLLTIAAILLGVATGQPGYVEAELGAGGGGDGRTIFPHTDTAFPSSDASDFGVFRDEDGSNALSTDGGRTVDPGDVRDPSGHANLIASDPTATGDFPTTATTSSRKGSDRIMSDRRWQAIPIGRLGAAATATNRRAGTEDSTAVGGNFPRKNEVPSTSSLSSSSSFSAPPTSPPEPRLVVAPTRRKRGAVIDWLRNLVHRRRGGPATNRISGSSYSPSAFIATDPFGGAGGNSVLLSHDEHKLNEFLKNGAPAAGPAAGHDGDGDRHQMANHHHHQLDVASMMMQPIDQQGPFPADANNNPADDAAVGNGGQLFQHPEVVRSNPCWRCKIR